MAYDEELAGRIRDALAEHRSLREVSMFGGLSFMVNEAMVVCARGDGDLLVRVDPQRNDELLSAAGAAPAEMGAGRAMGKGWITVGRDAVSSERDLGFWLGVALEYNGAGPATRGPGRPERAR